MLRLLVFDGRFREFFFERRIRLELLLNQVPQFEHRRLQNLQTLLKLRSENLRLREGL